MTNIIYRAAESEDAEALARLGRDSFVAAFGHVYDPGDLDAFLREVYDPDIIAGEIVDAGISHRLAFAGETMVGFCKLILSDYYPGHSDAKFPMVLGQLYTDPERTGEGIGANMLEWAVDEARNRQCDAVQLSVWSENLGAQRFYQRHGFRKIADIDFWVGNHCDDEYLYERKLREV